MFAVVTAPIAVIPLFFSVSTLALVVAWLMAVFALPASWVTWFFSAVFSSSVKLESCVIWFVFSVTLASIAAIALAFLVVPVRATFWILRTPSVLALFKSVSVCASFILVMALFLAVSANPFTSVFSSLVKELSLSILADFVENACSTSFFAPSLFNVGVGALGIVTAVLIFDVVVDIWIVPPYRPSIDSLSLAVLVAVIWSPSLNGVSGVHVARPPTACFVAFFSPFK